MRIMAERLTNYILNNGVIKEDEMEIFKYGFQTALEMSLCIIISFLISCKLGMLLEGVLFFLIFIPLRSYAGGLHLNNYWSCLFLSCLTFTVILVLSRLADVRGEISFLGILFLELFIWCMYPVENVNRTVDKKENSHFKKKLGKFLLIDLVIAVVCFVVNRNVYLLVILITFFMVTVTMVIGKYKNRMYV